MIFKEEETKIVVIGGGSGPISIEDELLDLTPHVTSITGTHDNGNNTKLIRSALGVSAPGDATHRMAVHIRNLQIRNLFTHRWDTVQDEDNNFNGRRPSNELLATAEYYTKAISKAVKLLEDMINPTYYKGRVIPVTDDRIHLRACLEDDTFLDFEDQIGERNKNKPAIINVNFLDENKNLFLPIPNPESIDSIYNTDAIIIAPSSLWTSNMPILRIPKITDAICASKAPVILICNAITNYAETDGYKTSDFARIISNQIGKKIDFALLNFISHGIPANYETEKSYPVEVDKEATRPFVETIFTGPFTEVFTIKDKPVIRHNGYLVSKVIMSILRDRYKNFYNGQIELPFLG